MTGVNGVKTPTDSYYTKNATSKAASAAKTEERKSSEDKGAVYETGNTTTKKTYTRDTETINRLLKDMEQKKQQLQDLVFRTLGKQGDVFKASIFDMFKNGGATLSAEEIAQAKEDVSEDGYWGVEQTSERLYSFAYALAGGDPSKADDMLAAIEKGYKQATESWGDDLPEICKNTLEATREKINAWKNTSTSEQ